MHLNFLTHRAQEGVIGDVRHFSVYTQWRKCRKFLWSPSIVFFEIISPNTVATCASAHRCTSFVQLPEYLPECVHTAFKNLVPVANGICR